MTRRIRVFETEQLLAGAAAREIRERLAAALTVRPNASWVLSGGSTPEPVYRLLALGGEPAVAWERVDFFWGDERSVPPVHDESNYGRARAILLDPLRIPARRVHRIAGEMAADAGAARYCREVRTFLAAGPFDLVLLGLGADGHTASLFPGRPHETADGSGAAMAAAAPGGGRDRVSLTASALSNSRAVLLLAAGAAKAPAVAAALAEPSASPAARIHSRTGDDLWLLDRQAASTLARRGAVVDNPA